MPKSVSLQAIRYGEEHLDRADALLDELEECVNFPDEEHTDPAIKIERALEPLQEVTLGMHELREYRRDLAEARQRTKERSNGHAEVVADEPTDPMPGRRRRKWLG